MTSHISAAWWNQWWEGQRMCKFCTDMGGRKMANLPFTYFKVGTLKPVSKGVYRAKILSALINRSMASGAQWDWLSTSRDQVFRTFGSGLQLTLRTHRHTQVLLNRKILCPLHLSGTVCDCGRYRRVVGQLNINVARLNTSIKFLKNGKDHYVLDVIYLAPITFIIAILISLLLYGSIHRWPRERVPLCKAHTQKRKSCTCKDISSRWIEAKRIQKWSTAQHKELWKAQGTAC